MADDDLVAFIDESLKPIRQRPGNQSASGQQRSFYAAAAAVVLQADLDDVRERLTEIAHQLSKGLHYASLSRQQRIRAALDVYACATWDAVVAETNRPVTVRNDRQLRGAVFTELLAMLSERHGVARVVVESRSHPSGAFSRLDHDDTLLVATLKRAGILPAGFDLEHGSKSEAMLQLADIIVGARTDWLCAVDRGPWGVIAHRAQTIGVSPRWKDPRDAEAPGSLMGRRSGACFRRGP